MSSSAGASRKRQEKRRQPESDNSGYGRGCSRAAASFNIGIRHDFANSHQLAVDIVWIDFSNFELSEIYLDGDALFETDPTYEDITGLAIGYNFPVSERVRLGIGGFITDEIIKDDNRTMLLRLDTATSYGVGIEWTTRKGNALLAMTPARHCERSEAIWLEIASSGCALLAMTQNLSLRA